jgi:ATP-dependent DNA helicase RecQ
VPYLVLGDETMRTVAQARPQNREELARVRGVGPRTLAKFGDDLLRIAGSAADPTPT